MEIFFTIFLRKDRRKISDDNDSTYINQNIFDLRRLTKKILRTRKKIFKHHCINQWIATIMTHLLAKLTSILHLMCIWFNMLEKSKTWEENCHLHELDKKSQTFAHLKLRILKKNWTKTRQKSWWSWRN